MSIFPKRVTGDENVIIHLKFISDNEKMKYLYYRTRVISPSGNEIKCWESGFYMAAKKHSSSSIKEFFLCVEHFLLIEAGKYYAKTELFLDGKVVNSRTEENDFFYVDKVEVQDYKRIDNMVVFEIKNMANNTVPIKIYNESDKLLDILTMQPKQGVILEYIGRVYIEYKNGTILPVKEKSLIYLKEKEFSWRIKNNIIELFNDNTFEAFCLPNKLAFLWLNCNGLNDLVELSRILEVDMNLIVEMTNYLLEKGLINKI